MNKKIELSKKPKLKIHKYVVELNYRLKSGVLHTKYFYCVNMKEVKERVSQAKKGSFVHVFKAKHTFIQAYAVE